MSIVTLVRHTRLEIAPGLCYGRRDVDVATTFEADARDVLRQIGQCQHVYTSHATRCQKLAAVIAQRHHTPLHIDERLHELDFGDWDGMRWNEINRSALDQWAADISGFQMPNGESGEMLMQRAAAFFSAVLCNAKEATVVVSHGGTLRALLAVASNQTLAATAHWSISPGAVVMLQVGSASHVA
jgi:alpha-ribazole phosphatase